VIGLSYFSYAQESEFKANNSLSGVVVLTGEGGVTVGQTDYSSIKINYLGKGSVEYIIPSESKSNLILRLFGGSGLLSGTSTYLTPRELNTSLSFIGTGLGFTTQLSDVVYPYIGLGASFMWVTPKDNSGNNVTPMFKILGLNADLGVRFMINRDWSINIGGGAITGAEDANDDKFDGQIRGPHKDWIFTGTIGISYFIGRDKDADNDGVFDSNDMCPNTPRGVKVDQFGCPIDSDGDRIPDYLDKCENTPLGVKVDANGCPLDSDADGVPDYLDNCSNTPARVQVDEKGCPLDSDNDGVPDYLDRCPGTPAYVKVDLNGCPLDADRDGVPDYLDKCPNTPAGTKVDDIGCPKGAGKQVGTLTLGVDAAFNSGKYELLPGAYRNLIALALTLKDHPNYKAEINGYTDSMGKAESNLILSQKRAQAVADYLVSQGIDRSRLEIIAHGESDPISSNSTREGRAQNRRVDIRLISTE
jgi:outer membrane protein OmpA-like peptidoglycan-associated protein